MTIIDNDLLSIQEARILAENAFEAQKRLSTFSQEKLDEIVESVANAVEAHLQSLAVMSHEETEYGRWQDKYVKNRFVCGTARQQLRGMRCVGIIGEDQQNQIMDVGVPVGVIVALSPATSPISTTIYNALIAIKSGNSVIFSPHPRARKSICTVLDIIIEAAESSGLPEGSLAYLHTVTSSGTIELIGHKSTALILNTGVATMLQPAYAAGKPMIYGGTGNGPAFIERSADIKQAVLDIITSKSFDHGIASAAEQSVVVESCIATDVKREMQSRGAYFMSDLEAQKFSAQYFLANNQLNPQMVGVSAKSLAKQAGFSVPEDVTVLVAERKYVSDSDPFLREMLCPVLTFYVEDDWLHACEKCIELLLNEKNGHTLVIHSKDQDVIAQFALKKPVGRMLVNTPAVFGGMGATTNLFPSMTLGSGSAGYGFTSDNVSPLNLIYTRKVGYGVRKVDALGIDIKNEATSSWAHSTQKNVSDAGNIETIQRLLQQAIGVLDSSKDM